MNRLLLAIALFLLASLVVAGVRSADAEAACPPRPRRLPDPAAVCILCQSGVPPDTTRAI